MKTWYSLLHTLLVYMVAAVLPVVILCLYLDPEK